MRCRERKKFCYCVTCRRSGTTDLPPSHSESAKLRPLDSLFAYEMALQQYGSSSKASHSEGTTEFEILKSSHQCVPSLNSTSSVLTQLRRFLRADDEGIKGLSWNDKVAKKYYDNLYKEFAVCDLKHYKSGNVRQPC